MSAQEHQIQQPQLQHNSQHQQQEQMRQLLVAEQLERAQASGQGVISRLVDDSFGYLRIEAKNGPTLSFTADRIKNYLGESWEELGLSVGSRVEVTWSRDTEMVSGVRVLRNVGPDDTVVVDERD